MSRHLLTGLVALVLLLLLMLSSLPARVLPFFIDHKTLRISALSGTLLNGRAARAMVRTPAGYLHLGELRWRLEFTSLLTLAPRVAIQSKWGGQRLALRATVSGESVAIRSLEANFDADVARQFAPVELAGRVSLMFDEVLVVAGALQSAKGRAVWQDALWQAPNGARPLGSYAAVASSPASGGVDLAIETLAGPVRVDGSASLRDQRYALALTINGDAQGLHSDLEQALSLIATPAENGYLLRLDGAL